MQLKIRKANLVWIGPLIVTWLIYGCIYIPNLFDISFLREEPDLKQVNLDWLLDKNWATSICENGICNSKSINESLMEFSNAIEEVENSLIRKKELEIILIANADRKNPESPCYDKSINNCLGYFTLGISKQASNPDISTDEAIEIVGKLKALNWVRTGRYLFEVQPDSNSKMLTQIALALSRDIEDIPTTPDQIIESVYNRYDKKNR